MRLWKEKLNSLTDPPWSGLFCGKVSFRVLHFLDIIILSLFYQLVVCNLYNMVELLLLVNSF